MYSFQSYTNPCKEVHTDNSSHVNTESVRIDRHRTMGGEEALHSDLSRNLSSSKSITESRTLRSPVRGFQHSAPGTVYLLMNVLRETEEEESEKERDLLIIFGFIHCHRI